MYRGYESFKNTYVPEVFAITHSKFSCILIYSRYMAPIAKPVLSQKRAAGIAELRKSFMFYCVKRRPHMEPDFRSRLRSGRTSNRGGTGSRSESFTLLPCLTTGSWVHLAYYWTDAWGSFSRIRHQACEADQLSHLHLVSTTRMSGVILPLPYMLFLSVCGRPRLSTKQSVTIRAVKSSIEVLWL